MSGRYLLLRDMSIRSRQTTCTIYKSKIVVLLTKLTESEHLLFSLFSFNQKNSNTHHQNLYHLVDVFLASTRIQSTAHRFDIWHFADQFACLYIVAYIYTVE